MKPVCAPIEATASAKARATAANASGDFDRWPMWQL